MENGGFRSKLMSVIYDREAYASIDVCEVRPAQRMRLSAQVLNVVKSLSTS